MPPTAAGRPSGRARPISPCSRSAAASGLISATRRPSWRRGSERGGQRSGGRGPEGAPDSHDVPGGDREAGRVSRRRADSGGARAARGASRGLCPLPRLPRDVPEDDGAHGEGRPRGDAAESQAPSPFAPQRRDPPRPVARRRGSTRSRVFVRHPSAPWSIVPAMAKPAFSLEGKIAIVTGGGTGIGKSIAIEFARAGSDVAICSRKLVQLEPVGKAIRDLGRRSFAMVVD